MYCPKIVTALKGYNKEMFGRDLIAGIIVGIIALPLSIALAISSGASPVVGLHTAIIAGLFIALLGGSRVQIGGPTGAFVVIVAGIIAANGMQGLILAGIMAGIILVLMGVCKLGRFIKLVPSSITVGFTNGIAVTIFLTQIKDLLGLSIEQVPSEAIEKLICYGKHITQFNSGSILISAVALLIMIGWKQMNRQIPGSLIAIIVTTLIVKFMQMQVPTIGSVYPIETLTQLPKFVLPVISARAVLQLLPSAITIAFLAAVESLLSAVVADQMIGDEHDANAELIGQGAANILGGFFGCIPATGAIARTAANVKNGGRTPVAGIVHALTLFVILIVLMPLARFIPLPALAGVLAVVSYNMGNWHAFAEFFKKKNKTQFIVMMVTFILTIIVDLVAAIIIGVVLYVIGCSILTFRRKRQSRIIAG